MRSVSLRRISSSDVIWIVSSAGLRAAGSEALSAATYADFQAALLAASLAISSGRFFCDSS